MNNIKAYFAYYVPLLKSRTIITIIISSFIFSIIGVGVILYFLWNIAPSFNWISFLIGSYYFNLVKMFWNFIIFSVLIFLIPPLFSIILSFFLDKIVEEVYFLFSKKKTLKLKTLSHISGIIVGLKILIYTTFIFILIIVIKIFFISNNYINFIIQFLLTSYVICKEYSNLICFKFSMRNPGLLINIKNGIICNFLFSMPVIGLIAPILSTIIMTTAYIKRNDL